MKRRASFVALISLAAAVFCLVLLLPRSVHAEGDIEINSTNFPDQRFQNYVKKYADSNKDGYLSEAERLSKKEINAASAKISSLKGLEYFPNLTKLVCSGNNLTELDVSFLSNLKTLSCSNNMLTELDVTNNTKLETLECYVNKLEELDVTNNTKLERLYCSDNKLLKLYVNNNPELIVLDCGANSLPGIDLSKNPKLKFLDLCLNPAKKINITGTQVARRLAEKDYDFTFEAGYYDSYMAYNDDMFVWGGTIAFYKTYYNEYDEEAYHDYYFACDNDDMIIALDTPEINAMNKDYGIRLSWAKVDGASEYEIWRAPKGSSDYELKASYSVNSYTDNTAEPGNTYTYKVVAKNQVLYSKNAAKTITRNPFTDVSESASYYNAVLWAVQNGITSGTSATTFSPNADCTRYQFAVMLYKLSGKPAVSGTLPFKDVKKSDSYYNAVLWAYTNGIISGTSSTTFSPKDGITRYQVVQMLYKYVGKPPVTGTNPFKDVSSKASYYKAVLWAVQNGITKGTDATHFSPNAVCKRYQLVVFLYKFNNIYHIQ